MSPSAGPSATGRWLAAVAVALLVVGAGAAVGMGTSGSSGHRHGATAVSPGPGLNPGGPVVTAPPVSQTTATTAAGSAGQIDVPSPAADPGPAAAGVASGGGSGGTTTTTAAGESRGTGGQAGQAGDGPATGTYSYATSGSSSVLGQTYPLPPTTTIVISASGCGQADRWNEGSGDSTTIVGCPVAGGIHIASETTQTTYDGRTETETFTCDPDSFVPLSGTPGQTWRWSCRSSGGSSGQETSAQVVTLDGPASVEVGGTAVPAEHVSIVSTLTGPISGRSDTEDWFAASGLRVKETGDIRASQYGVTFTSTYTITAESLRPS